jgi:hypothetical protein
MSGSWAVMSAQIPLFGEAFAGGEQLAGIFGDLRGGLAELGAAGEIERGGASGALAVFGVADLGRGPLGGG